MKKIARGWKFRINKEDELYYPCSENKDADQLRSYCEADLRLCFHISKNPVFSFTIYIYSRQYQKITENDRYIYVFTDSETKVCLN